MPPTETPIPRKAPARTSSRKRARRAPSNPAQRQAQINAYYDLKKSPAFKQARATRMRRLGAAKWAAAQAQIPVQWRALMVIFRVMIMSLVLFVMFRIMLKEKQLLAIKSFLTRQQHSLATTKMSWKSFQHAYETRFRRPTPSSLQPWLNFAQENACEPFKMYTAIERDLLPFRKIMNGGLEVHHPPHAPPELLHWDKLQDIATNYTKGAFLLVQIRDHTLTILDSQLTEWFQQHPTVHSEKSLRGWWERQKLEWNLQWLMDPVIQHKPPIHTRFVINLHHRPRSPPDAVVPIFSSHSESYHTDADPTHPGDLSLEISNKNRNGVIDTRDPTTRDLLIPHLYVAGGRVGAAGMTSSPAVGGFWFWPFFRDGKPWEERKNVIAWRGSTLGNYDSTVEWGNHSQAHDFFSGPRFSVMQQWGGTDIHPIQAESNVQVDFAFTKLLLQGEEHMHKTQEQTIKDAVQKEFRFAHRLSFRQLQKYKYLLDVDGNAFSVRFSSLLRTGSLIFKSTRYREWFSERIRNWKDYIPVNYDTSDLAHKVEWANQQSPEVIANIIRHGKETVERHIRPEDMQCYTYRMVLEYTTLFDEKSFPKEIPSSAATTSSPTGKKNLRLGN
ncbi:KDEL motif-containing protein 1 [Seminavis robusta]|uniref:KDEL motif-containing protein 1 n=1 Tax=Seminavis robusta TaxID=568900 RepID=A0A9N8EFW2_9STRA|nr:KDEL motif-containing protein 1 [Seminavis robusta]|eukprot:Sro1135_g245030.1 KDEL motif-containing protein 1 (613) ;mRNA; r:11012-13009